MKRKIKIMGIVAGVLLEIVIISAEVAFLLLSSAKLSAMLIANREYIIYDLLYDRTFEKEDGTWIAEDCGITYCNKKNKITAVLTYKGEKISMILEPRGSMFGGSVIFMAYEVVAEGKWDITDNEEVNKELEKNDGFLFRARIEDATDRKVIFKVEKSYLKDFQFEKIEFRKVE